MQRHTGFGHFTRSDIADTRPRSVQEPHFHLVAPLVRFIVLYAALYSAFGVILPFLPSILQDRGLTPQQIGTAFGLATAIRLISGPLSGRFADQQQAWRGVLSVCAVGAGAVAPVYVTVHGVGLILRVSLLQSALLAPLASISDAMAVSASRWKTGSGFEYGWVRAAGSAAFIAGSIGVSQAATSNGLVVSVWLHAALLSAAALSAMLLPAVSPDARVSGAGQGAALFALLRMRTFRRLMLLGALVLGSHALHDTFAVIRWREAGISTLAAGLLWAESVMGEVFVFLLVGPPLLRRIGPTRAMAVAAAAAAVRWTVLGTTTLILPISLVEPLHGLTFALFHLAAMRLIGATVPNHFAATAQAVYGTLAVGAATAVLTLVSGALCGWLQGSAFYLMAMLCVPAMLLVRDW